MERFMLIVMYIVLLICLLVTPFQMGYESYKKHGSILLSIVCYIFYFSLFYIVTTGIYSTQIVNYEVPMFNKANGMKPVIDYRVLNATNKNELRDFFNKDPYNYRCVVFKADETAAKIILKALKLKGYKVELGENPVHGCYLVEYIINQNYSYNQGITTTFKISIFSEESAHGKYTISELPVTTKSAGLKAFIKAASKYETFELISYIGAIGFFVLVTAICFGAGSLLGLPQLGCVLFGMFVVIPFVFLGKLVQIMILATVHATYEFVMLFFAGTIQTFFTVSIFMIPFLLMLLVLKRVGS